MTTASERLIFGTAGIPLSAQASSTISALERIHELGLECMEVEFVMGVKMGSDLAKKIKEKASALHISLSTHAPYFINLNAPEQGKRLASQERLLSSARMAYLCGAECVVFHAGYYGKSTPEEACETVKKGLKEVASILHSERNPVALRLETMGKKSQFGSLEEVLFLCREVEGVLPCLDFSHLYAREGKANSYLHFHRILNKVRKKLGDHALKNLHIHISGVHFSGKGELKHIDIKESNFRYDDWIQALKDFEVAGKVICESPNLETDALMLKHLYESHRIKGMPRREP